MNTYIALLRGINVSGQKKIKMAELRQQLGELGLEGLQTYIQSGNLVFSSVESDSLVLAESIKHKIQEDYGFEVPTQVWGKGLWEQIFTQNPFLPDKSEEIAKLHVTLLAEIPTAEQLSVVSQVHFPPDEFICKDQAIYLYCPNGYGRTKLTNTFWERKLKVAATTRNWKTMTKLREMVEER
ncbi:MAG: DUF1697 domain-containing protein [Bacteroidota bacterium]